MMRVSRGTLVALICLAGIGACGGGGGGAAPVAPPVVPPTTPPVTVTLDTTGFLEFAAGTAPLVIVAPHGGSLKPTTLPDRTCAGCEVIADANTEDLARLIVEAFAKLTGKRPFLALNHLHRSKFDGNRDVGEATGSNSILDGVWSTWQSQLDSATVRAARVGGRALYVEVHGHAHAVARIELGYLLSATQLRLTDGTLAAGQAMRSSSIARLVTDARSGASDVALLRGAPSLGALLYAAGYPAVPSPADPAPKTGEDYFNGGYNTVRHGSLNGGATDAVQMEFNNAGLRDTAADRSALADALAGVLAEFLKQQYGWPAA
jgi:N-formylglutamate amidohydrolase